VVFCLDFSIFAPSAIFAVFSLQAYAMASHLGIQHIFPEIGLKRYQLIVLTELQNEFGLPVGEYVFMDAHCQSKDCDCRRMMIEVHFCPLSQENPRQVATLSYGWEPISFYYKWFGSKDPMMLDFKGPSVEINSRSSPVANGCLDLFKTIISKPGIIERYKRHYTIAKMVQKMRIPKELLPYAHTRQPCDCKSGELFLNCCGRQLKRF
jgi:hypothetical protein